MWLCESCRRKAGDDAVVIGDAFDEAKEHKVSESSVVTSSAATDDGPQVGRGAE